MGANNEIPSSHREAKVASGTLRKRNEQLLNKCGFVRRNPCFSCLSVPAVDENQRTKTTWRRLGCIIDFHMDL